MSEVPTNILHRKDWFRDGCRILTEFDLTSPHWFTFEYKVGFGVFIHLVVDGQKLFNIGLGLGIGNGIFDFNIEGHQAVFAYKFCLFRKQASILIDQQTIMQWEANRRNAFEGGQLINSQH
jgi:hypothetical protein